MSFARIQFESILKITEGIHTCTKITDSDMDWKGLIFRTACNRLTRFMLQAINQKRIY